MRLRKFQTNFTRFWKEKLFDIREIEESTLLPLALVEKHICVYKFREPF